QTAFLFPALIQHPREFTMDPAIHANVFTFALPPKANPTPLPRSIKEKSHPLTCSVSHTIYEPTFHPVCQSIHVHLRPPQLYPHVWQSNRKHLEHSWYRTWK